MRFIAPRPQKDNINNLMRRAGYQFWQDAFVRSLARHGYPRFHIYLRQEEGELIFNLHLDQKKPSYQGSSAHSGEYDGELVEKEADRIREIFKNQ